MMNRREYRKELDRLRKLAPDHILLPTLKQGFDVINAVYLQHALRQVDGVTETPKKSQKRTFVVAIDKDGPIIQTDKNTVDPVLRDLWATRGKLFRQSGKTSNKFHVCKTDEERKAVSIELLGLWDQIQDVKAQITHYEQYGQVMQSEERFPLPDDPILLMKKLHAIRQSISEQRAKIKRLADQPDGPEKDRQIAEAEEKLNHSILYRGHAEQRSTRLQTDVHE